MVGIINDSDSDDDMPPGWEERATSDGNVYYVNHFIKATQWTHPQTGQKKIIEGDLPPGWERIMSDNGKILYVDHKNRITTYVDPRLAFATEYTEQSQPFRQRFDGSSTALAVLHGRDLKGKVALITGGNSGIGFEIARSLALHGCTIILACRDIVKAQKAMEKIFEEQHNTICEILQMDLTSMRSVRTAAEKFKLKHRVLDILILNAGIFAIPYTITEDGYEMIFQVNYLSQFYLTLLLEQPLRNCLNSRIVIISSESHRFSMIQSSVDIHPSVLSPPAYKYWAIGAYNNSKLCNIIFAQELAKRWPSVNVFSCHPGNLVPSGLCRHSLLYKTLFAIMRPFTKSLQQAASTPVFCATAPELEGTTCMYFNNCFRCDVSNIAKDPIISVSLWNVSKKLIMNVMRKDQILYEMV